MASRRRRTAPASDSKLKAEAKPRKNNAPIPLSFPHIDELIEDGDITLGMLGSVGCVATAADADITYAMLLRRRGETLLQFLIRLDQALDKAFTLGIFTDEINS